MRAVVRRKNSGVGYGKEGREGREGKGGVVDYDVGVQAHVREAKGLV